MRPDAAATCSPTWAFCANSARKSSTNLACTWSAKGVWHQFPPPGGITALFLLTESHLSLHTYPESGIATFNLYCCRPRRRWEWEERLAALLGAKQIAVRRVVRGSMRLAEEGKCR